MFENMKKEKQNLACQLRKQGFSMSEIQNKLKVSKSSISLWVRDIKLTKKQKERITKKGKSLKDIEKRRKIMLIRGKAKRQLVIDQAKKEIKNINDEKLKVIGTMLYWAEGGKTQRSLVRFANADPIMILVMMVFFRKICKVKEEKFRGYLHIHPHLDYKKAEKYWSKLTGISLGQFFKTYRKMNVSSKNKKDTLPNGTFDIYICDTNLFLRIKGWTEGVCKKII